MRTDRRGLLRIMGGVLATAFGGRAAALDSERRAPRIHSATENVLLGPVGERRPKLSSAPPNFKPYPNRPRMALPSPGSHAGSPLAELVSHPTPPFEMEGGSLSALELARLLYFTNGVTGSVGTGKSRSDLRAAPSAGAHYAGEVYVVAERVEGVPPGIYSYAVAEHELVQLRKGSFAERVADAAQRPSPFGSAAAIVLLTCVFGRYTWRYANRGYRYALIDTGHISENLRLAATSAGIAEVTELHFLDAELNELLGVDGRKEAACALHAIGRRSTRRRKTFGKSRAMVELQSSDRATPSPSGYVTDRYHQATTLLPSGSGDTAAQAAVVIDPSPTVVRSTATRTAKTKIAVEQAIARRRSPLRFREAPIQRDELRFVADMAVGNAALRQTPGLRLYVIAHRVRDLPAGLYRVDPVTRELGLLEQRNMARALTRACRRQQHARLSAAAFLMVGSFAPDAPELGDRSYRDLLMESGAIGERIYLAAESLNLAARNLAAFTDITLNHLVGVDGRSEAVLHLTVLGHRPV